MGVSYPLEVKNNFLWVQSCMCRNSEAWCSAGVILWTIICMYLYSHDMLVQKHKKSVREVKMPLFFPYILLGLQLGCQISVCLYGKVFCFKTPYSPQYVKSPDLHVETGNSQQTIWSNSDLACTSCLPQKPSDMDLTSYGGSSLPSEMGTISQTPLPWPLLRNTYRQLKPLVH